MPPEPKGTNGTQSYVGMDLYGTDGQWVGKLQEGFISLNERGLVLDGPGGIVPFQGGSFLTAFNQGINLDREGNLVGTVRALPLGGGGGGSAPAFSSTQAGAEFGAGQDAIQRAWEATQTALQNEWQVAENNRLAAVAAGNTADQRRWEAEQDEIQRRWQEGQTRFQQEFQTGEREAGERFSAEQNRLAEEASLKRQRLGTLSDLIQSFVSSQAQARDTLANLQPDPFRFAAVAGGIAPFGTTPQQGFQQQLQQFAGAAVPQFDPSGSAASLEPVIAQLTGAKAPQAPQVFGATGLEGGGTVPAPFNAMSVRLVGEKGPEVMVTSPQGVTILPLDKGAQEGGFFPFEPIKFDTETLMPALGTSGIFGSLGFSEIPQMGRGLPWLTDSPIMRSLHGGFPGQTDEQLRRLGIAPKLVGSRETGVWFIDSSGVRRHISNEEDFNRFGFNWADVMDLTTPELERMYPTQGSALTSRPPISTEAPAPFTRFSAPIIEPTTGVQLPAPFMVASQMNKLRLTNPFAFNLLLSAYQAAGVPGEAVMGTMQQALPFGMERGLIGLN